MGWSFNMNRNQTKEQFLAELDRLSDGYELLRRSVVGNNVWQLVRERETGRIFIGLCLIARGPAPHGWGYKGMDENWGPVEVNCPLSFLKEASPPEGHAVEWRERVRAYHAAKKARPKYVPGLRVACDGRKFELTAPMGRRGWRVRESTGDVYRMSFRVLSQCAVEASP